MCHGYLLSNVKSAWSMLLKARRLRPSVVALSCFESDARSAVPCAKEDDAEVSWCANAHDNVRKKHSAGTIKRYNRDR